MVRTAQAGLQGSPALMACRRRIADDASVVSRAGATVPGLGERARCLLGVDVDGALGSPRWGWVITLAGFSTHEPGAGESSWPMVCPFAPANAST